MRLLDFVETLGLLKQDRALCMLNILDQYPSQLVERDGIVGALYIETSENPITVRDFISMIEPQLKIFSDYEIRFETLPNDKYRIVGICPQGAGLIFIENERKVVPSVRPDHHRL